jgi:hypothetical protein
VHAQHSLLQVVNRRQSPRPTDSCAAVERYLVVSRDVGHILGVEEVLAAALAPVVQRQVLDYRLQNLVVLFLGCAKIWPRQVLQLRDDPTVYHLASGVLLRELEPALDQVGHEGLDGEEANFFVVLEGNAADTLVFPDLTGPVLVALDLRVLLQVGQHNDQRDALLVHHTPEVLDGRLKRPLRRNEQLVVL